MPEGKYDGDGDDDEKKKKKKKKLKEMNTTVYEPKGSTPLTSV
jgi:hypothetical protein